MSLSFLIFQANAVIKKLNLAYNGLSNDGAAAMAECLKVNDILIDVDLTCNRIFDEGAAFLSKALSINETLKYLRVSRLRLAGIFLWGVSYLASVHCLWRSLGTFSLTCVEAECISHHT